MNDNDIERTYDRVLMRMKLIGLFQIIGGLLGFIITGLLTQNDTLVHTTGIIWFITAFLFFIYAIFCGVMLFVNKALGLRLTLINFILQIVQVVIAGYSFRYVCTIGLPFGFDLTPDFRFHYNLSPSFFSMYPEADTNFFSIEINVIAILLAYYVIRLTEKYNDIVKDREVVNIDDIGT